MFIVIFFVSLCRNSENMANKLFRIVAAVGLLSLYLSVTVGGDLSVIFCDCHSHHAHQNVAHEHQYCSKCDVSHQHDWNSDTQIADMCGCHHDHSNNIELYTFSRSVIDDLLKLYMLQPVLVAEHATNVNWVSSDQYPEYDIYLLPPLSSVDEGSAELRAPPVLV